MTKGKASRSLPLTIALQIPTDWTPEQAFAAFAMIDELREAIWRCYSLQIQDQYRDQCGGRPDHRVNRGRSDQSF